MEYIPILLPLALADDGVRERSDGDSTAASHTGGCRPPMGSEELIGAVMEGRLRLEWLWPPLKKLMRISAFLHKETSEH